MIYLLKVEENIAAALEVATTGMDEEALRVSKLIKDKGLPGILNGKPVKTKFVVPVRFSMQ